MIISRYQLEKLSEGMFLPKSLFLTIRRDIESLLELFTVKVLEKGHESWMSWWLSGEDCLVEHPCPGFELCSASPGFFLVLFIALSLDVSQTIMVGVWWSSSIFQPCVSLYIGVIVLTYVPYVWVCVIWVYAQIHIYIYIYIYIHYNL